MPEAPMVTAQALSPDRPSTMSGLSLLWAFAGTKLLVHLLTLRGYGIFRDELYYLACSDRLAWGYVDHPPLSVGVLRGVRTLLGDDFVLLRIVPAPAGSPTVWLVGWTCRELGGGRFAQSLAMLSALVAPIYLALHHFYSMNAFDTLIWAAAAALLAALLQGRDPRLWLALGAVLGLGLLNKLSVLWLGAGVGAALLVTGQRRWLTTRWPWLAAVLAGLSFLPHILWQVAHGWPTREFIANATGQKMVPTSPWDLLSAQLTALHPLTLPVWVGGLIFLLLTKPGRPFRLLGWIWLAVFGILAASPASRASYLASAVAFLLPAGGLAWERWTSGLTKRRRLAWLRPTALAVLFLGGAVTAPLALPTLPVDDYVRYAKGLGMAPSTAERKELGRLPQFYADMIGWEELVGSVTQAWRTLTPEEQRVAGIFALNYGVAGAIDHFGPAQGLPPARSGHNNYWLWGPRGMSGDVILVVGGREADHRRSFREVELIGRTECGDCMPYEDDQGIFVGRGLRRPVVELWPRLKHFD